MYKLLPLFLLLIIPITVFAEFTEDKTIDSLTIRDLVYPSYLDGTSDLFVVYSTVDNHSNESIYNVKIQTDFYDDTNSEPIYTLTNSTIFPSVIPPNGYSIFGEGDYIENATSATVKILSYDTNSPKSQDLYFEDVKIIDDTITGFIKTDTGVGIYNLKAEAVFYEGETIPLVIFHDDFANTNNNSLPFAFESHSGWEHHVDGDSLHHVVLFAESDRYYSAPLSIDMITEEEPVPDPPTLQHQFDSFCETKTTNSKITSADFICELDIYELLDTIASLQQRVNELTALHYPTSTQPPPTVSPPDFIPLPLQPELGPTHELAPEPAKMRGGYSFNEAVRFEVYNHEHIVLQRGETPLTYTLFYEYSKDGINWMNGTKNGNEVQLYDNNYEEILFRAVWGNDFGIGNFTLIHSAIPMEFTYRESGWTSIPTIAHQNHPTTYLVSVDWVAAIHTFGFERINTTLERSINYGEFEKIADLGDKSSDNYQDSDVELGNIYSYRVQTTTTNEVHPRSGFTSILFDP